MKKKCYSKELCYVVPHLKCKLCNCDINPGDGLYSVVITWGSSISVCKKCYDEFEVDWSLHFTHTDDETDEGYEGEYYEEM